MKTLNHYTTRLYKNSGCDFGPGSVALTNNQMRPWFVVDLGESRSIQQVSLKARSDNGTGTDENPKSKLLF